MIATLRGELAEKFDDCVVLDVQGVGYGVIVSHQDQADASIGDRLKLYIYEHIREQSHELFGFKDKTSKELFEQLLGVNGVGPKMAMSLLNIGEAEALRQAIAHGDVRVLQSATGVGKRVAERIVVDLKDKIELHGAYVQSAAQPGMRVGSASGEAAEALLALGYAPADVTELLNGVDDTLSPQEQIKWALQNGAR